MAGRNRGDAADVNQTPVHHLRKFSFGLIQRAGQINPRPGAVNIRKRGEKIARAAHGRGRPVRASRTARFPRATTPCSRRRWPRRIARGRGGIRRRPGRCGLGVDARQQAAPGSKINNNFSVHSFAFRRLLAEQFILQRAQAGAFAPRPASGSGSGDRPVLTSTSTLSSPLGGIAAQGVDRRIVVAQACEYRAVEETGMPGQQMIELRQFGQQVVRVAPGQAAAGVDIDFFRRQPFHAAGEAVTAADAGQRAQAVAHERPDAAAWRRGGRCRAFRCSEHKGRARALWRMAVIQVARHVRRRRNFGKVPSRPIACRLR